MQGCPQKGGGLPEFHIRSSRTPVQLQKDDERLGAAMGKHNTQAVMLERAIRTWFL